MNGHQDPSTELTKLVQKLDQTHGRGTTVCLDGSTSPEPVPVIPTGIPVLDQALGVGGYPRGRITELFGPEGSGRTTLALHAVAEAQSGGGIAAFIDVEHAFDSPYATAIGVNLGRLLVSQPDTAEQALDIVEVLSRSGTVDLIVLDSIGGLVSRAEVDGELGGDGAGLVARLLGQSLRKLAGVIDRTGTTVLCVNDLRQQPNPGFGAIEGTTGGQALKYYASVRLDVRRTGPLQDGEVTVGHRVRVKVVKNKCAAPFTEAVFDIRWSRGVDVVGITGAASGESGTP